MSAATSDVQHERAGEAAAELVAVEVVWSWPSWTMTLLWQRSSLSSMRLRDDADVGDAGLLDGVHDGGEGAEGNAARRRGR